VTAAFFALGGLGGSVLAMRTTAGGADALGSYLEQFLTSAQMGGLSSPDLFPFLWRNLRWPLGAFLLGFSALGLLGIPLLSGLRGFFLGFSVGAFAQAYGRSGLAVAFLLQGLPGLIAIPVFFLLAVQSFSMARGLLGRGSGQGRREAAYDKAYLMRCGVCAAALGLSLLIERYLVPALVTGWAGALLR